MRLRNRIIKATFYTDPELLRWPRAKREFYRSLWACADDSACIEDDMFGVKVAAWPSPLDSDMTEELFILWRDELIASEKLIPYTNGHAGHRYLYIPTMAEHERPRNPQEPDYPLPPWVTFDVQGEGRARRLTFTHRDWRDYVYSNNTPTVQTSYSDSTRTPVLSCPALSSPVLSSTEERENARPEGIPMKTVDLPQCMSESINVTSPIEYKGTNFGFIVRSMEDRFGEIPSNAELATLKAAIVDGCLPGCDGRYGLKCTTNIVWKLNNKAKGTFRTSNLWLKCIREDRYEVKTS